MFIFLDTETTGVTPQDRIVSICWALYDHEGTSIYTVHNIIRPEGFTIPDEAAAIHGITTEIARKRGIALSTALCALHDNIAHYGPSMYVGHNVSFDRPIVLNEYARTGLSENISPLPTYCTMKGTTHICRIPQYSRGGYKWPKLEELHRYLFGHEYDSAHDAEGDVRACAKCYFELRSRSLI